MNFKSIFTEAKGKFKVGDSIKWDGDVYKITGIVNDEAEDMLVYEVNDSKGSEMTLDMKVIDKTAKKA